VGFLYIFSKHEDKIKINISEIKLTKKAGKRDRSPKLHIVHSVDQLLLRALHAAKQLEFIFIFHFSFSLLLAIPEMDLYTAASLLPATKLSNWMFLAVRS